MPHPTHVASQPRFDLDHNDPKAYARDIVRAAQARDNPTQDPPSPRYSIDLPLAWLAAWCPLLSPSSQILLLHLAAMSERFTDRWADILEMKILPLDYEDLVDDAEGKITDVLDFLGIGFDRSSVDFHKSDRVVMTPSWNQVSRPMNRDAVDRWRRYERHLGPLIEAFGE